ncbi:MAG: hypothetical protein IIA64_12500 [Planctomycetes bacterium]|nr:hypothetical protein [Planctomycetota bacterium]
MAAFALNICIWLAVTGGTASVTGVWKLLVYVTSTWILAGIGVLLVGALLRPITARPVTKFCRDHHVLKLPPEPRPQVGERFGHHRVYLSDSNELLLGQQRFAGSRELARALGLGGFVGLFIFIQVVMINGWVWQILAVVVSLGAVVAWIRAVATPVPVQWLASSAEQQRRLTIEYAQLIFRRFTRDIAGPEMARLFVAEGKLYLHLRDGELVLLATVGFGPAGRWRSRRIGRAIHRIVGAPDRIRFENDRVVERLAVNRVDSPL